MGVPAFYRWLLEKYPKCVEDILEERVHLDSNGNRIVFDWSRPNPSGLECDNLYIDMNGIIHPCSHPEDGSPLPTTEEEMYDNVCRYVDRLVRIIRPRQMLYLAIDGVAPRAKMNQQRSRRFRSAEEAREQQELEQQIRKELIKQGQAVPPESKKGWDSNVITPGTPFMIRLAEFLRFYVRKRITHDPNWQSIRVVFSDASIPGEGEHKIMSHIRYQRSQPGYDPNLVHILHGLDADLIMLALATHEAHFYISRELVTFGRKSLEQLEQRQLQTGFQDEQKRFDEDAGAKAMETLPDNRGKPLQRVCIPILREYLAFEFQSCLIPGSLPFTPSLERLIDDIVFMCFFVGNDFLPHLPSLDIRDGALDFLFNVYKRLLPTMGDYITNHGGQVKLELVDRILLEVGAIEDTVFQMKHENETREAQRRKHYQAVKKKGEGKILKEHAAAAEAAAADTTKPKKKAMGRAARILEKKSTTAAAALQLRQNQQKDGMRALQRGHTAKKERLQRLASQTKTTDHDDNDNDANAKAAMLLKQALTGGADVGVDGIKTEVLDKPSDGTVVKTEHGDVEGTTSLELQLDAGKKRTLEEATNGDNNGVHVKKEEESMFDQDLDDDVNGDKEGDVPAAIISSPEMDEAAAKAFKEKVKQEQQKKLDQHASNVEDKVRLHEAGWKDRYYSDKCKADNVAGGGGREHLFRSYVIGLCWVMKYYYSGCPSWKWYYPFHYAPFASDLKNISRFQQDVQKLQLAEPFRPIEQLMAVLPEDSSHAVPKESRWLMSDPESPIIDFYPKEVQVDPNGKAMPWLWVVLLPFIDERRLLDAFHPTQEKWNSEEKFCNSIGLDDGYVFIHENHGLKEAFLKIFDDDQQSRTQKCSIRCGIAKNVKGFSGSVRLPLSNEALPLDKSMKIPLPSTANRVLRSSHDNLFTESIDGNSVVCVAFSEPPKMTHKSVMLPGSRPPPEKLKAEDKIIRRPKLNRGRGTIANMGGGGGGNGRSYQSGYGSMNIGNFERDLANRTGRGHQMYQAGTRTWGAAEPTPKRPRQFHQMQQHQPPYQSNPFGQRGVPPPPPPKPPQQPNYGNNQQWQQQKQNKYQNRGGGYRQQQQQGGRGGGGGGYHQQQQQQPPQQGYQQNVGFQQQGYQQPGGYGNYQQPQQGYQQPGGYGNYQQQPPQQRNRPYTGPPGRHQPQQQQQGYNFQNHNRSAQPQQRYQQQQQPPEEQARANPTVLNNLRSQLANTLRQHRNNNRR